MCGIVGYVGPKEATPILVGALRRLEYRGYDSAGIAVKNGKAATLVRSRGKLIELEKRLATKPPVGNVGIGHTRWATHGGPSEENAHPHKAGPVSLVHNGIIENHASLRRRLMAAGRRFSSETDTEVLAHLIAEALEEGAADLAEAVRVALRKVEGAYAIAVISDVHGERIVAAKNASPLVVGIAKGETFLASDVSAFLEHTQDVLFLDDGEMLEVTREGMTLSDLEGRPRVRPGKTITWTASQAEKGGYAHFMLKEIHEQPRAVADTLRGRLSVEEGDAELDGFTIDTAAIRRIVLLACGSSYHAAMVGKHLIESLAHLPCEIELASEFRYRDVVIGPGDLVIAISQSGETADTLAAVKEARARGARILAISNVVDSAIPRAADGALYTHAGPEIAVASTKAFTAQLSAVALLALHLGRRSGALGRPAALVLARELAGMPEQMGAWLASLGPRSDLRALSARYGHVTDLLFLGRGTNYPIALEGALKLKEISYIHAEGYAAGEMKHGPIALIGETVPVVVIATAGPLYPKVMSNLTEVRTRKGQVIAVATEGDEAIASQCEAVVWVPPASPLLQPLLTVLPLQLLAYEIAVARNIDVDQPRNLAKSVTVE